MERKGIYPGQTRLLWEYFRKEYENKLPIPLIAVGDNHEMLFSIRQQGFYFEIELLEQGIELYFHDQSTGKDALFEFDSIDERVIDTINSLIK